MKIVQMIDSTGRRRGTPARLFEPKDVLGLLIAVAAIALLQRFLPEYWNQVLVAFLINVILVTSYRLITTMGGWSFAHVAFAAIGAYTMALLTTSSLHLSFWWGLLAGPLAAAALAMLLAYPILRTRQYNFFLSTFAAAAAIQQSLIQFSSITGGSNGIAFIPRPNPVLNVDFASPGGYLWLTAIITLAVVWLLVAINRSNLGRTIEAVAANEQLSESLGIFCWKYRAVAFVIGSSAAGLAGVLMADFNRIINPADFGAAFMFKIVAAAIIGGTRSFHGPVLGLAYLTALEELFRGSAEYIPLLWGVSVIAVLMFSAANTKRRSKKASPALKTQRSLANA